MLLNSPETSVLVVILFSLTWKIQIIASWKPEQSWTYEMKNVGGYSANPDLMDIFDYKAERVDRGIYAASVKFTLNYDIVEGDNSDIESNVYRSPNGVDDYGITPFKVQRQHIFKFLNTFYKDLLMGSLSECSNLPVFEGEFEPPFEKKTYILDKCQFDQAVFPQHMQEGFYKVVLSGYGDVEWSMTFIVEITKTT